MAIGGAAVGLMYPVGGAAFGPATIDARHCDPAAVDFFRRGSVPARSAAMPMTATADDLCFMSGRDLAALIRSRKVSSRDVMTAHLRQIERINPVINAIVAKLDDRDCLALAEEADRALCATIPSDRFTVSPGRSRTSEPPSVFRSRTARRLFQSICRPTTRFSSTHPGRWCDSDRKNERSGIRNGIPHLQPCIRNSRNPYDTAKSAGGSSGGAAARSPPDCYRWRMGATWGSLRNPASFNNVVGFRPSVGLVPTAPTTLPFLGFGVKGPIARSVGDVAFLMSVMAGSDRRDPAAYPSDPSTFLTRSRAISQASQSPGARILAVCRSTLTSAILSIASDAGGMRLYGRRGVL